MACRHERDFNISIEYITLEMHSYSPDGSLAWDDGDPERSGMFRFYCNECGYYRWFERNSNKKKPKWLNDRIRMLDLAHKLLPKQEQPV